MAKKRKKRFAEADDAPRIRTSFSVVTEESVEAGDFAETGWEDEEGQVIEADEEGDLIDAAVEWLDDQGGTEPSSSHFHKGTWYSTPDPNINYRSGESKYLSFHLVNFSEDEQREIFEAMQENRVCRR